MALVVRVEHRERYWFATCDKSDDWCPKGKLHGHFWREDSEIPVNISPDVYTKTEALALLFKLINVLTGDALRHNQEVERIKREIADSNLPE